MSVAVDDITVLEPSSEQPSGQIRFRSVLASEWIKLVSVRSTVWALVVTAVVGIGLGAVVTSAQAARYSARTLAAQQAFDPTRSACRGSSSRSSRSACSACSSSAPSTAPGRCARPLPPSRAVPSSWRRRRWCSAWSPSWSARRCRSSHFDRAGHSLWPHSHRVAVRDASAPGCHRRRSLPRVLGLFALGLAHDHPSYRCVDQRLRRLAVRAPDHRGRPPVVVL